jgi:hypothetical protein
LDIEIKSLIRLSCSGVFCLENPVNKRVYLNFSKNKMGYIARVLEELETQVTPYKQMIFDKKKLRVRILEVREDIETLDYWVTQYQNEGWEIYNAKAKRPLPRVPKVMISSMDKTRVEARLYNKRKEYEVVGIFDNLPEAETFLETCYGDNNPHKLRVIAANFLTRKELPR